MKNPKKSAASVFLSVEKDQSLSLCKFLKCLAISLFQLLPAFQPFSNICFSFLFVVEELNFRFGIWNLRCGTLNSFVWSLRYGGEHRSSGILQCFPFAGGIFFPKNFRRKIISFSFELVGFQFIH